MSKSTEATMAKGEEDCMKTYVKKAETNLKT